MTRKAKIIATLGNSTEELLEEIVANGADAVLVDTYYGSPEECVSRINKIKELRESKHPLDKPSLGSTFKNPEGDFAARLISECGLKGTIIGNAQIAEKHPNFVLNLGGATFEDITNILTLVKESVFEKFGVKLEEEIIIVK